MKYFSQLNKHTQAHTTDLCHNSIPQTWPIPIHHLLCIIERPIVWIHSIYKTLLRMDRWGPKHVQLKTKCKLKLTQWNHIVYLVGLYIYFKNDTRTLQCRAIRSFETWHFHFETRYSHLTLSQRVLFSVRLCTDLLSPPPFSESSCCNENLFIVHRKPSVFVFPKTDTKLSAGKCT